MTIEELKEIGKKSYILLTPEEFDKLKKDAECTERTTDEYARIAREEIKKRREIEKQIKNNAQQTGQLLEENYQLRETINSFQQNKRTASVVINTLKQQLAEKDKEIERLKKNLKNSRTHKINYFEPIIRHQICKKIKENSLFYTAKIKGVLYAVMKREDLKNILDQIEKGE